MKVYELQQIGFDGLKLAERAMPTAGPGEVLLRVRACSVNYRDLLMAKGAYLRNYKFPMVPLSDGAGEVVATGGGVTRFRTGDRVAAAFMPDWVEGEVDERKAKSAMGAQVEGMAVEYKVLPESALVSIPDHLTFEEAATLPCAAVTAWHALMVRARIGAGATVLTLGSGGVSVFALQLAKAAGARVFATSSSEAKLDRLRDLGADAVHNYKADPEWDKAAREWTGGVGVDHVVEVGGPGTFARSTRAVRMGGSISLIGVVAGSGEVNLTPVFMKNITVHGMFVGSREMFEEMNRTIAAQRLKPVIDRVFPFADLPEAMKHMQSGSHFGKVVVRLD